MKLKKAYLLLLVLFFSCKQKENSTVLDWQTVSKDTLVSEVSSKYLSESELQQFLINRPSFVITNTKYKAPFDSLKFNKVIAYDFDGMEEGDLHVVVDKGNYFSPVVLRQKELTLEQINLFINFITKPETYGEGTKSCFQPHLGVVFYQNEKAIFEIDICLDCNYLIATTEIPAMNHKKMILNDITEYSLIGFSKQGKRNIINFCKSLDLDYASYVLK
ncbi:hypothetical protein [Flavobacterium sp. J27]|uniref:hypothetical protein n=1 Tax=Flavobacterium sp. J27 TaxID=2060419 RepID=UPI001031FD75|nr:hypothetical protein [Flavobacterium sp. J27]